MQREEQPIKRCNHCGTLPLWDTAKSTDDIKLVIYRLLCPNCGKRSPFYAAKHLALQEWNQQNPANENRRKQYEKENQQ